MRKRKFSRLIFACSYIGRPFFRYLLVHECSWRIPKKYPLINTRLQPNLHFIPKSKAQQ
jgi:hypothetical protein